VCFAALAQELARRDHDVHVATITPGEPERVEHAGVSVHLQRTRGGRPGRTFQSVTWGLQFERALHRLGSFDVLFAPEWGGDGWACARSGRPGPLVTNLTTSLAQILEISPGWKPSRTERLKHRVQTRLERYQAENSAGVVAASEAVLEWTRGLWGIGEVPTTILPHVVDVGRVRLLANGDPPPGWPRNPGPIIAFSGRLESRKGIDVLARAMTTVWEAIPEARLVVLGADAAWNRGRMSAHLQELAGPSSDRLHLLGHQPPEHLFAALARADVVALPSLWENLALAALEAMALGRALVLTSVGGFRELLRDGIEGLLVPPGDSQALATTLVRLLKDPELRDRLGAQASSRADLYRPHVQAPGYEAFFETVARPRS
jgi:glycogen synthase